jgi:hypothetical protein
MPKRTRITLDDTEYRALLALQARYQLATAHEALCFALRVWALSPAQRPHALPAQELKTLRRAESQLQQFAERVLHDVQGPLFVVRTALELLSSCPPAEWDAETKKWIDSGVAGVQQLQAVLDKLWASTWGSRQEQSSQLGGRAAGSHAQRRASPGARANNTRSTMATRRGPSSRGSRRPK